MAKNSKDIGDVFHDKRLLVHCSNWGIELNNDSSATLVHHSFQPFSFLSLMELLKSFRILSYLWWLCPLDEGLSLYVPSQC